MPHWSFKIYTTKAGQKIQYARSRQPIRDAKTGEVTYRTVERSCRTASIQEARELTREFDKEYHEAAFNPKPEPVAIGDVFTFADAVGVYIRSGNSSQYLKPIIGIIGLKPAASINQEDCLEVVSRLYPNAKASTVNRQVFTPISAVLRFSDLRPNLKRPKGHDARPAIDRTSIPADGWFAAVMPHLSPKLRALLLLINLHGLRIGEALNRTPDDVDPKRWTLSLPRDKAGNPVLVKLSEPVIEALKAYEWRKGKWLFGTKERSNISRDIAAACEKAGVPRYSSHKIGRHSFATQILEAGKSLPFLKKAGRWASTKAVEHYAHMAKSEVDDEVREMAKGWQAERKQAEIVPIASKRKSR